MDNRALPKTHSFYVDSDKRFQILVCTDGVIWYVQTAIFNTRRDVVDSTLAQGIGQAEALNNSHDLVSARRHDANGLGDYLFTVYTRIHEVHCEMLDDLCEENVSA